MFTYMGHQQYGVDGQKNPRRRPAGPAQPPATTQELSGEVFTSIGCPVTALSTRIVGKGSVNDRTTAPGRSY